MDILIVFVVSLSGPVLASYFAAQVMRETKLTKSHGSRSQCDHCGVELGWFELVPLFSYIFQRGRCKHCSKRMDPKIFLSEVLGLALFFFMGLFTNSILCSIEIGLFSLLLILAQLVSAAVLLYLSIYDLFTFTIPSNIVLGLIGWCVVANVGFGLARVIDPDLVSEIALGRVDNLTSAVGAAIFVFILIQLTKNQGIGIGDLYLGVIIGLMLGWPGIITAFYVLVFSSTAIGLAYAAMKRKFRGLRIPMVPFISLGYVVALVWGSAVFDMLFPLILENIQLIP